MSRIAILADVHANREAFDAVIERLDTVRPDQIIVLGDLVGYGPDPAYVVDRAKQLMERGAICLLGNHDEAVEKGPGGMNEYARDAIRWTQAQLSADQKAFLKAMPMLHFHSDVQFTHASAARGDWPYIRDAAAAAKCLEATVARTVICGHTHVPAVFYAASGAKPTRFTPIDNKPAPLFAGRRQVVVAGSVGQPRDGNPAACLAVLETQAREITMLRVPYDSTLTANKVTKAGLPSWLGHRLQTGS
jgi:predicted phosphodiesterase